MDKVIWLGCSICTGRNLPVRWQASCQDRPTDTGCFLRRSVIFVFDHSFRYLILFGYRSVCHFVR